MSTPTPSIPSSSSPLPVPPYPDPDDPRLVLVIREALAHLHAGIDPAEVAIWIAVHGWYEGYIKAAGEHLRGNEEHRLTVEQADRLVMVDDEEPAAT